MNHSASNPERSQHASTSRFVLFMMGIFISGCLVGGAITRAVSRYQWRMAMKNPENLGSRISPQLVSSVGLRAEQRDRVEYLINKRYEKMEALRAETYPLQLAEFEQLCDEIEAELDNAQRTRWANLVKTLKNDYLPPAPLVPPPTDFLFRNFDANNDGILEAAELPSRMWMRVRNADSDDDDAVSRSEFESARSSVTQ